MNITNIYELPLDEYKNKQIKVIFENGQWICGFVNPKKPRIQVRSVADCFEFVYFYCAIYNASYSQQIYDCIAKTSNYKNDLYFTRKERTGQCNIYFINPSAFNTPRSSNLIFLYKEINQIFIYPDKNEIFNHLCEKTRCSYRTISLIINKYM